MKTRRQTPPRRTPPKCRKKRRGVNPLKRGSIFGSYDPWKGTIFAPGFRKAAPLKDAKPADAGWTEAFSRVSLKHVLADVNKERRRVAAVVAKNKASIKKMMARGNRSSKAMRERTKPKQIDATPSNAAQITMRILKFYPQMDALLAETTKPFEKKVAYLRNQIGSWGSQDPERKYYGQSEKGATRINTKQTIIETVPWKDFIALAEQTVKGPKRPKWMLSLNQLPAWRKRRTREEEKRKREQKLWETQLKKRNKEEDARRAIWHRYCDKMHPIWDANEAWLKRTARQVAGILKSKLKREPKGDEIARFISQAVEDRGLIRKGRHGERKGWVTPGPSPDPNTGKESRKVYFESTLDNYDSLLPGAFIEKKTGEETDEEEEE